MAIDSPSLKPPSSIAGICARVTSVQIHRTVKQLPFFVLAHLSGGVHREIFCALRSLFSFHAWRHLPDTRGRAIVTSSARKRAYGQTLAPHAVIHS